MQKQTSRPIDRMSSASLDAMLEYMTEEVETAETKEELLFVLALARELITPKAMQNAVIGLDNIRAEVDPQAIAKAGAGKACTVELNVPQILSTTFLDLSERMLTLQNDDPDTFANATSALTWLASGAIRTS